MSSRDMVKMLGLSLQDGESEGFTCPECGRTDSFYITRDGSSLKFIDFSVSCGFKGVVDSKGSHDYNARPATPKVKQYKLFKGRLEPLSMEAVDWLSNKFRIPRHYWVQVRYSQDDGRVYFPQYKKDGRIAHYIARYYLYLANGPQWGAKAMVKHVMQGQAELYFPSIEILEGMYNLHRITLVEDYPSALRIWSQLGEPCCCLGGTALYEGHVQSLIDLDLEDITLILDNDAIVKAVKLKRQMALAFPNMRIITLPDKDPKDMTPQQLVNLIGDKL